MKISVGSDILEIARVERLQQKSGLDRIFTEEERRQSEGSASRLAGDFSVKEAVSKAFGTGIRGFSLLDIEVLRDGLGKPYVKLYGNALKIFLELGYEKVEVSISNTKTLVIATAILLGQGKPEKTIPKSLKNKMKKDDMEEEKSLEDGNTSLYRDKQDFLAIPERNSFSHKGSYGTVEIFAGKKGMAGAAAFSATAAYRAGAGLVHIVTEEENRTALQIMVPEAIVKDISGINLEEEQYKNSVLLFGPGIGTEKEKASLLLHLLNNSKAIPLKYLILDADALNMIAENPKIEEAFCLAAEAFPIILTPHLKEFSRLCHVSMEEVLEKRVELGKKYAKEHHCILILKSHDTMVFAPFSEKDKESFLVEERAKLTGRLCFFHNQEPCPSLSKGGSGDIFAGFLAGLLCVLREKYLAIEPQELAFQAACLSVLIQVRGGMLAAKEEGEHAVLARELPHYFAKAMQEFIEKDDRENDR